MSSSIDDSIAGIATEVNSQLNSAISTMFAKGGEAEAKISAIV
jgi:hypothetical protein